MPELTPRIGLLRPLGTDHVTREAYAENLDIIDAAVVRPEDVANVEATIDPAEAPTGNAGTLGQLLGWLANRIRAITGAAYWWSTPPTTLAAAKQHMGAGGGAHAAATSAAAGFMSAADKALLDQMAAGGGEYAPASHVGAGGTAHATATTSAAGFMSSSDKSKLNGIASGAEKNQNAFGRVSAGSTTISAGSTVDTLAIAAGTGITVSGNATSKTVTIAATGGSAPVSHGTSHVGGSTDPIPTVTTSAAGLMSSADKVKLDGLPSAAAPASHVGAGGTAHTAATTSVAGFMSATDKSKLDGLSATAYAEYVAMVNGKRAGYAVYAP